MFILSYLNTSDNTNLYEDTRIIVILPINVNAMIPTRTKITNVGQHRLRIFSDVVVDLSF